MKRIIFILIATFFYSCGIDKHQHIEVVEKNLLLEKDLQVSKDSILLLKAKIDTIVALEGREAEYTEILLNEEDYGVIEEIVVRVSAEKLEEEKLKETEGEKVEYVSIEPVEIDIYENDNAKEAVMEKNKVTETIRKEIASAFAMKEERITVYQEER